MNTYFELLYETFYQMIHKLVVPDYRLESIWIVSICVSVLIGVGILLYQVCTDKLARVVCNEFWLGIILLLPILGLIIYAISDMAAKMRNVNICKMYYRKEFWLPVACNVILLCLAGVIPFPTGGFMRYLGTQEPIYAIGMECFLISALIGLFILNVQIYRSCNIPHIFQYKLEAEDGESINNNEILGIDIGRFLSDSPPKVVVNGEGAATFKMEDGAIIDLPFRSLRNKELESYCLLKFEDSEDHTYAEYASNYHGDERFIVTNIIPRTDDLFLSYIISLMYGMIVSFPIYYCILMKLL